MQPVNFPLRISYPASLPYAHIRANAVELAGDRVTITYQDAQELGEWEEEQLSPEEKRREEWFEYGDREYHRMKDEELR